MDLSNAYGTMSRYVRTMHQSGSLFATTGAVIPSVEGIHQGLRRAWMGVVEFVVRPTTRTGHERLLTGRMTRVSHAEVSLYLRRYQLVRRICGEAMAIVDDEPRAKVDDIHEAALAISKEYVENLTNFLEAHSEDRDEALRPLGKSLRGLREALDGLPFDPAAESEEDVNEDDESSDDDLSDASAGPTASTGAPAANAPSGSTGNRRSGLAFLSSPVYRCRRSRERSFTSPLWPLKAQTSAQWFLAGDCEDTVAAHTAAYKRCSVRAMARIDLAVMITPKSQREAILESVSLWSAQMVFHRAELLEEKPERYWTRMATLLHVGANVHGERCHTQVLPSTRLSSDRLDLVIFGGLYFTKRVSEELIATVSPLFPVIQRPSNRDFKQRLHQVLSSIQLIRNLPPHPVQFLMHRMDSRIRIDTEGRDHTLSLGRRRALLEQLRAAGCPRLSTIDEIDDRPVASAHQTSGTQIEREEMMIAELLSPSISPPGSGPPTPAQLQETDIVPRPNDSEGVVWGIDVSTERPMSLLRGHQMSQDSPERRTLYTKKRFIDNCMSFYYTVTNLNTLRSITCVSGPTITVRFWCELIAEFALLLHRSYATSDITKHAKNLDAACPMIHAVFVQLFVDRVDIIDAFDPDTLDFETDETAIATQLPTAPTPPSPESAPPAPAQPSIATPVPHLAILHHTPADRPAPTCGPLNAKEALAVGEKKPSKSAQVRFADEFITLLGDYNAAEGEDRGGKLQRVLQYPLTLHIPPATKTSTPAAVAASKLALTMCQRGFYAKALQCLTAMRVALADDEIDTAFTRLLPVPATPLHPLTDIGVSPTTPLRHIEVSASTVSTVIHRTRFDSAPGPSGLSFLHLKTMLRARGKLSRSLVPLIQDIVNGEPWTAALAHAILVPVPKNSATDIRPIAIGESLRRIAGRILAKAVRDRLVKDKIFVDQYGLGEKCGAELMIAKMRALRAKGQTIAAFDLTNAYGTVSRPYLLRVVEEYAPVASGYLHTMYENGNLHATTGSTFSSDEGIQQGCPVSPLAFSLAMMPILAQLRRKFPPITWL
ncbi:hypothetical protein J8273_6659 [Carpediemonas membranifera]|uniref:Reverse transcriptase domain-containing protein n=1 Tax=Carpediemonas membranifera TaxID=201153 RepID=A0A8J6ARF5_9EUKA|nr:hypothetical protein J8273_6659 [Carpediemonas membranifera]|eukprot:KAG9392068.1 hypothetical protein J8273_6659 [Carpediemonas membranifera]